MRRGSWWLPALTWTTFALQTDDLVVVGVLREIAVGLRVSEAATGQLVTVFSLVCAVVAPAAAVLARGVSRRTVSLIGLSLFTVANLAAPLAGSFATLMGLRVIAAIAAAFTLPATLAITAELAGPDRRGRALATVMLGFTAASVVGVPLGTALGAAFSWPATFVCVGFLGLLSLAAHLVLVPRTAPAATTSIRDSLQPLTDPAVTLTLAVVVLAVAGNLAFQTYLGPFLAGVAGVDTATLATILVAVGVAGMLGGRASGTMVDRTTPTIALMSASTGFAISMAALAGVWALRPVPPAVVLVPVLLWAVCAWATPTPVQSQLLTLAGPEHGPQLLALASSAVYLGATLGAGLGGAALGAGGAGWLPPTALACTIAAILTLTVAHRMRTPKGPAHQEQPRHA